MIKSNLFALTILALLTLTSFLAIGVNASSGTTTNNEPNSCSFIYVSGPAYYATPVILLNSPFGSNSYAQASSSQSYTASFNFAGFVSSEKSTGEYIPPIYNGQAEGIFQLDGWDMYRYTCIPGGSKLIPKIVSQGGYCSDYLMPSGSISDENEPTQVNVPGCGESITFQNGFTAYTSFVDTCSGAPAAFSTETQNVNGWSLSISVGTYVSTSGTASITTSSDQAYYYYFQGYGDWSYQALGSGGNSGWSFSGGGCGGPCPPYCSPATHPMLTSNRVQSDISDKAQGIIFS